MVVPQCELDEPIPVMRPVLATAREIAPYLESIDAGGIYSNFGPLVKQLEMRYGTLLGVPMEHVVMCANATLGLGGAVKTLGKRTWIVPAWTFPATALAPLNVGCGVTFADVSLDTWMLEDSSRPTRGEDGGRIVVIPFGSDFRLGDFDLDEQHVVVDAAASLGNLPRLTDLPESWAVVFSLHATKILGCGEGGLVVFGSISAAERFRSWSNFGFSGSRVPKSLGTNAKMPEVSAAFALAALDMWTDTARSWRRILSRAASIGTERGLGRVPGSEGSISPYWIAAFDSEQTRDRIEGFLNSKRIGTRRWWPEPLTRSTTFLSCSRPSVPNSEFLSRTTLGLPMHLALTQGKFDRIDRSLASLSGSEWPSA